MDRAALIAVMAMFSFLSATPSQARDRKPEDQAPLSLSKLQMEMAAGRLTAVQLVERCLDRITRYDRPYAELPGLNAVLTLSETARAEAAALDAERKAGHLRGPLHGIPLLVKDNIDVAGMPTSGGNASLRNYRPRQDAFVIARLRQAGAIIIGKTNLHEFAWDSTTVSGIAGQTFNAYDQRRDPGGSSGGSAAAVAAQFAIIALGTDTGGSLRIPAAHNNLVSMRATFGLVSRSGVLPMTYRQDMAGPIAHSVEDAATLLDVMAGHDPDDSFTLDAPVGSLVTAAKTGTLNGKKIALLDNPEYRGSSAVDPVIRKAVATMRQRGALIVEYKLPQDIVDALTFSGVSLTLYEMQDALNAYFSREVLVFPEQLAMMSEPLGKLTLSDIVAARSALGTVQPWLQRMLNVDRAEYAQRLSRRAQVIEALSRIMIEEHFDALIYPSVRDVAPLVGRETPRDNGQLSPLTGFPAITVPAGFTESDLPVGLEFMGMPFSDGKILGMAREFEQSTRAGYRLPPFLGLK